MIELIHEDLSKYTTIRIGGIANRLLIPENRDELTEVIREKRPVFFIGGGSNLLISNGATELVVSLRDFDQSIESVGGGKFRVGASVRLPKLIQYINEEGYGGIEYLCNVPGLVGGAVAMNAGTGEKENKSISDYVISVDVIRNGEEITMMKEECAFFHRDSFFRSHPSNIIVSVLFQFPKMAKEKSARAKEEKMRYYREHQDPSNPNFGSVFRVRNHKIMAVTKMFKIGKRVHFSGKTENWIINEGGTYSDAIRAIRIVEELHKLLRKKCVREVVVWDLNKRNQC